MRRVRTSIAVVLLTAGAGLLVAASPKAAPTPEDLIREASSAAQRGDAEAANHLYQIAEEKTGDPGLVAFNRGAMLFQIGRFREAELLYRCVLEDRDCPAGRQARAWYNRGTCLLRRGCSAPIYRDAIADLERCAAASAADEPLKADARHNLELAKVLWNEARKKNSKPDLPNDPPEDSPTDPPAKPNGGDPQPGAPEPGDASSTGGNTSKVVPQAQAATGDERTNPSAKINPGTASHLQPLQDTSTPQPLSPEDTRAHLKRTEERIDKDRRDLLKALYGPERPGALDW